MMVFVVAALGRDIFERYAAVHATMSFPLFRAEGSKELGIVVGMSPDTSRRVGLGINKELVLFHGIKLSDPSRREITILIFH